MAMRITPSERSIAVRRLVEDIQLRPLSPVANYEWPNAPLNVLDCVLSLNRHYDRFALPRVRQFRKRRPEVETLASLKEMIRSYSSLQGFGIAELSYDHADRMRVLIDVTERLMQLVPSDAHLNGWAMSVSPSDRKSFGVRGFGPAGFQYLRMLFGVQTFKPDRHIINHVKDVTGHQCDPDGALVLLEEAVSQAGVRAKDLDYAIWLRRSGGVPTSTA